MHDDRRGAPLVHPRVVLHVAVLYVVVLYVSVLYVYVLYVYVRYVVFLYDFLTFPIYWLVQQPWKKW